MFNLLKKKEEKKWCKADEGPMLYDTFFLDNTAERNGEFVTFLCAFRESGYEDTVAEFYGTTEEESRNLAEVMLELLTATNKKRESDKVLNLLLILARKRKEEQNV